MESLNGKKLLVISSDSSDIEFVKAAKDLGVYVICCDRYADWKKSPAKMVADEAWDIDYTDTETVAKKCIKEKIDGVIAGYSEDRVLAACRISMAINKPFYATENQINITRNKGLFKEICQKCGIDTPRDYSCKLPMSREALDRVEYPVIVKPSDNGGRKGISVCNTEEELLSALKVASEFSKTGDVVVEEYLTGTEMSAIYTLVDGEISLSCVNDKYISEENEDSRLCDFVITPSQNYEKYVKEVDLGIKELLKTIGARDGVANFQFIASQNGIKAFEMGYRVNGNNDFKVIRKYNDIDFMKMLITYVLTGEMGDSLEKDNPLFGEYYCTLVLHLKAGTIGMIDYDKLKNMSEIDDISIWRKSGDVIANTGTNAHKSGMIKFTVKNLKEIIPTIEKIQKNVIVSDINGEDMCFKRFNPKRLLNQ